LVGEVLGETEGLMEGDELGELLGLLVGGVLGEAEGLIEGALLGVSLGLFDGDVLGKAVGFAEGEVLGELLSIFDGELELVGAEGAGVKGVSVRNGAGVSISTGVGILEGGLVVGVVLGELLGLVEVGVGATQVARQYSLSQSSCVK
jgi:hypothetical protein